MQTIYSAETLKPLEVGQLVKTVGAIGTPEQFWPGVKQVFTVLCVADVSSSLAGTYFDCSDANGPVRVYFTVASVGSVPAITTAGRLIHVNVAANAADTVVATAVNTAMDAEAQFVSTVSSATVTVTQLSKGLRTTPRAESSGFTLTQTVAPQPVAKMVPSISISGRNARGTDNTGNVYVGFLSTNDTQLSLVAPGQTVVMRAPEGAGIDLADLYIDAATAADGVIVNWPAIESPGEVVITGGSITATVAAGTLVNSAAYEASHVLKASAGTLISLIGYNSGGAQFIQLYNSATVPANTAVPVLTITVAATSNFSVDIPITGMPFSTGIAVANSSTGPAKTLGGSDCYFTAVIR